MTVRVLIEDRRPVYSPSKLVEEIEMDVTNTTNGHMSGKWHVSASELLLRLQASNAAIEGKCMWGFKLLILKHVKL